jgi:hypothetical protein
MRRSWHLLPWHTRLEGSEDLPPHPSSNSAAGGSSCLSFHHGRPQQQQTTSSSGGVSPTPAAAASPAADYCGSDFKNVTPTGTELPTSLSLDLNDRRLN